MEQETMIIVSAVPWKFPDERTGVIREGVSVLYSDGQPMDPSRGRGWEFTKISLTTEAAGALRDLPGVYTGRWHVRPGFGGKPTVKLVGVEFVGPFVPGPAPAGANGK